MSRLPGAVPEIPVSDLTAAAEYYNTSDATQPAGATPQAVHAMRHFPPSSRVSDGEPKSTR